MVVVNNNTLKEDRKKIDNINLVLYGENHFLSEVKRHRMSILECLFLPKNLVLKDNKSFSNVKINLASLRLYVGEKSIDEIHKDIIKYLE